MPDARQWACCARVPVICSSNASDSCRRSRLASSTRYDAARIARSFFASSKCFVGKARVQNARLRSDQRCNDAVGCRASDATPPLQRPGRLRDEHQLLNRRRLADPAQDSVQQVVALCVGDTLDSDKGREAFPKTKADLLSKPNGEAMFEIARQALLDMAQHVPGFKGVVANPNKFCHGYGVFQYDQRDRRQSDPGGGGRTVLPSEHPSQFVARAERSQGQQANHWQRCGSVAGWTLGARGH